MGPSGLAELKHLHMESKRSAADICLCHNSTIVLCSQTLAYKQADPSGLAELGHLHVELNSEHNRHLHLRSTLSNSSKWSGHKYACGVHTEHDADTYSY